ncbi:MAG: lauroyl acyltransferase [Alphaproteobacteria bacterium]|nr:lauroyl acyltransferase [Alphaproteobacteria bacterium]
MARSSPVRPLPRRLADLAEAGGFFALMGLFRLLGLPAASALGGWLGRAIGPLTHEHTLARINLTAAFPEKGRGEIDAILTTMWDNLGRVLAEYPHLEKFRCYEPGGRVEVVGAEHVDAVHAVRPGGLLVSAHFANWEVMPMAATQRGYEGGVIYRAINNPHVNRWIVRQRERHVMPVQVPKGLDGARQLLRLVKKRLYIPILVDQKLGQGGVPVPFFGHPALTTPAAAAIMVKYDFPVFLVHCERHPGPRFRMVVSPRLEIERSGDEMTDMFTALTKMNAYLEERIRERPGEWLWAHNRWGFDPRKKKKRKKKLPAPAQAGGTTGA